MPVAYNGELRIEWCDGFDECGKAYSPRSYYAEEITPEGVKVLQDMSALADMKLSVMVRKDLEIRQAERELVQKVCIDGKAFDKMLAVLAD